MTKTDIYYKVRDNKNWLTLNNKHYTILELHKCYNGNTHMLLVQVVYTSLKHGKTRIKILQDGFYSLADSLPIFSKKYYSVSNDKINNVYQFAKLN